MSVVTKLQSSVKIEHRAILGPGGNRVRVSEEIKRKKIDVQKKFPQQRQRKQATEMQDSAVRDNRSLDSAASSDSTSSSSSSKTGGSRVTAAKRHGVNKFVKVVRNGVEAADVSPEVVGCPKRCEWITPNSDPLYVSFHDEEWGVPIHDDRKLFELLVFSQALAELSWPAILNKRDIFRKLFDNFEPSSIAQFTEERMLSLKLDGSLILSEPKLRAVIENARLVIKVQQEYGSFSNYCWRFANHKPIRNGFRYGRQVPVKSPKSEYISKDLMKRGFRCVGPTVIYSFMQVSGLVNDHLLTCYRYQECNADVKKESINRKIDALTCGLEASCLSHN